LSKTVQPAAIAAPALRQIDRRGTVPRRDRPDHAGRLAADGEVLDVLHPQHLVEALREVAQVADGDAGLRVHGEGDRLADLAHDHLRELVRASLDQLGEAPQRGRSLGDRGLRPRRKRLGRRPGGEVDILSGAADDLRDRLLGRGVDDRDRLAARGLHPRSVDEDLVADRGGLRSGMFSDGGHAARSLSSWTSRQCAVGSG
jgi:hypothetical protein